MYKIIGADQKEYGPVTGDQIRIWIKQGRINAQTKACAEGSTDWKTIGDFPEFAGEFESPLAPLPPSGPGTSPEPLYAPRVGSEDYDLNIGLCFSRSWALVTKNLWPVVGVSALIIIIVVLVNSFANLLMGPAMRDMSEQHRVTPRDIMTILGLGIIIAPLYSILFGGLLKYYLKLIRGESPTVADAFSAFSPIIGQVVVLGIVQGVLTHIGFLLCVLPGIYLAVSWCFALPLVMDRGMNFWEAMELSRKTVAKHWFAVFGLLIVAGLVACLGLLACCVGLFFSLPIAFVALMYGYEDMFGRRLE